MSNKTAAAPRRVLVAPAVHAHWHREGRHRFELGFLVGQSGLLGADDLVLAAIEVPSEAPDLDHDVEVVQSFDDLSVEWVVEIAKQIDRLLPGGVEILGLYVVAIADAKSATDQAALYLRAVASELALPRGFANPGKAEPEHHCIVHICSKTSAKTVRVIANVRDAPRSATVASELKSPSDDERLVMKLFKADVAVDEQISFSDIIKDDSLEEIAESRLEELKQQLQSLVERVWQSRGILSTESQIELLAPAGESKEAASPGQRKADRFQGVLKCVALVPATEPRAVELASFYLKRDFVRSLLARVNLLLDRFVDDAAAGEAFVLRDGGLLRFPARALMKWRSGATPANASLRLSVLSLEEDDETALVQDALEILSAGDELPGLDIDEAVASLEWLESNPRDAKPSAQTTAPGVTVSPSTAAKVGSKAAVNAGGSSNNMLFVVLPVLLLLLAFLYAQKFQ